MYFVDSKPEPGRPKHRTRLKFPSEPTEPLVMQFFHVEDEVEQLVFGARVAKLFAIRFHRFRLGTPEQGDGMTGEVIEYVPVGRPRAESVEGQKLVLYYDKVAATTTASSFDTIDVRITITRSDDAAEAGWIDFDIHHTYPVNPVRPRSSEFAFEQVIRYPVFEFPEVTAQRFAPPITDGSLQFSSVYMTTELGAPNDNFATGIALHVQNEHGHRISAEYDKATCTFAQVLRNSIHLKGQDFVRPGSYTLTRGDAYGWQGSDVHYRLRAFRERSAIPGAPVGWYDVVDLYRDWLSAHYGTSGPLYRKLRPDRPLTAPADWMSPHTVIMNWGLDGAVDPLPVPPGDPRAGLHTILEVHPALTAFVTEGSGRVSMAQLAAKLRGPFAGPAQNKIEVQTWGIEMAGFYQFLCGYPHLADAVHDDGTFALAVAEMAAAGAATTVTTDPTNLIFDRKRYAGHIRRKNTAWSEVHKGSSWEPWITAPFPAEVQKRACARTQAQIGTKTFNRVWMTEGVGGYVAQFAAAQKRDESGTLLASPPAIASGFYRASQKQICPTGTVPARYWDRWVQPHLFAKGVRIVEYMKAGPAFHLCYRRDHQHRLPKPTEPDPQYDNVIGVGSWHVQCVGTMFQKLHDEGRKYDSDPNSPFRLAHEFAPPEALVQYVDQAYSTSEIFNYVYSPFVTPMMSPGRGKAGLHPGYREKRVGTGVPGDMLSAARDSDAELPSRQPGMTDDQYRALFPGRQASFDAWRGMCVAYAKANFAVVDYGLAPVAYPLEKPVPGVPLVPWNAADPFAPTYPATYTFNRSVQSVFNLRANVFESARAAVRGLRIMIPSEWLAPPNDADRPALDHAILAARLQIRYSDFFRYGRMLGETRIARVGEGLNTRLCAWVAGVRSFSDVPPLVEIIGADDNELGSDWRFLPLSDAISRCWDRQTLATDVVVADRIEHRVWEHAGADGRRILYAFANLGNSEAQVRFFYGRGLEGTTEATKRRRSIQIIGGGTALVGWAWAGLVEEELKIPARGFAGVVVEL